jgi:hypothetical protein
MAFASSGRDTSRKATAAIDDGCPLLPCPPFALAHDEVLGTEQLSRTSDGMDQMGRTRKQRAQNDEEVDLRSWRRCTGTADGGAVSVCTEGHEHIVSELISPRVLPIAVDLRNDTANSPSYSVVCRWRRFHEDRVSGGRRYGSVESPRGAVAHSLPLL